MKKILTAITILAISGNAFAQGFYVRAGLGYGFPQASQTINGEANQLNGTYTNLGPAGSDSSSSFSIKKASFATGLHGCLSAGYFFNDHFGFELGSDIGLGLKKYTATFNNIIGIYGPGVPCSLTITQDMKTPVFLTPSFVLQSGGDRFNIYARLGAVLPVSCKISENDLYINAAGTGAAEPIGLVWTTTTKFSVGYTGSMGVRYNLNDRLSIWGEANLLSMSVYVKQQTLKDATVDGQGGYASQITPQTVVYGNYSGTNSTGAVLVHEPAYSVPYSSIGINVGIMFALSQHHKEEKNTGRRRSTSF